MMMDLSDHQNSPHYKTFDQEKTCERCKEKDVLILKLKNAGNGNSSENVLDKRTEELKNQLEGFQAQISEINSPGTKSDRSYGDIESIAKKIETFIQRIGQLEDEIKVLRETDVAFFNLKKKYNRLKKENQVLREQIKNQIGPVK